MKIILTHDVERLGNAGEVVEVKNGFARNYLLPRGYAVRWTRGAQKQIDLLTEARRKRQIDSLDEAHAIREAVEAATLTIAKKAGNDGHLFGGVSAAEIATVIEEVTGKKVDRRTITIPSSIKSLGSHKFEIKLHADVKATATVEVVEEGKKRK